MPNSEITVDPDKVRRSIISRLSESDLSDPEIAAETRGIEEVKDRYDGWASATGDGLLHLNNAAAYFTASILARTIRFVSFYASGGQFEQQPVNLSKRADELWADAESELAEVISPDVEARAVNSQSGAARNVSVF
jgi:hypothetical protein